MNPNSMCPTFLKFSILSKTTTKKVMLPNLSGVQCHFKWQKSRGKVQMLVFKMFWKILRILRRAEVDLMFLPIVRLKRILSRKWSSSLFSPPPTRKYWVSLLCIISPVCTLKIFPSSMGIMLNQCAPSWCVCISLITNTFLFLNNFYGPGM